MALQSADAQDIHFSQFNENPMHLNPAYTGMFDGLFRVHLNYRSQWQSMGNPYTTVAGAFDFPLMYSTDRAYMAIGGFFFQDKAGDSNYGTFQGLGSVSGIVPLNDYNKLSVGIQGGYAQRSATTAALTWESQYVNGTFDPLAPSNEGNLLTSLPYLDFGAGISYQYRSVAGNIMGKDVIELNFGGSVFHLNKPVQNFQSGIERLDMRFVIHSSARLDAPGTRWSFRPSGYYMQQGPIAREIVIGGLARLRIKHGTKITNFFSEQGLGLGVHYRFGDAIIPQVYYDLGDFFLGFTYDVNISKYSAMSKYNGGFEITIRYANLHGAWYKNKR